MRDTELPLACSSMMGMLHYHHIMGRWQHGDVDDSRMSGKGEAVVTHGCLYTLQHRVTPTEQNVLSIQAPVDALECLSGLLVSNAT